MILYFSATGNSEYVAKKIGKIVQDETLNLFQKLREKDFSEICSQRPWVVVLPTYAWRIPRFVQDWLQQTAFTGSNEVYFVLTCGGSIGNAQKYLKILCAKKNLELLGCVPIVMPENYIAMYCTPTQQEALIQIEQAETAIKNAALLVQNKERCIHNTQKIKDKIISGMINNIFYPVFVHAKKFYATNACISCGKCEKNCSLSNIQLVNKKPVWGKHCTHCMACICRCPTLAIEYGKHSVGLPRYICPVKVDDSSL